MKIFPSSSIKKLDAYTIEHEPIASVDLMERAATYPRHRFCRTGKQWRRRVSHSPHDG